MLDLLEIPPSLEGQALDFNGRGWVFERVGAWLGSGECQSLLVVGAPGTGKSAIAVRLAQMSNGAVRPLGGPHVRQGFLSHAHFCRAEDPSILPLNFVASLSARLANRYDDFRRALLAGDARQNITVIGVAKAMEVAAGGTSAGVIVEVQIHGLSAPRAFDEAVAKPLRSLGVGGVGAPITVLVDALDAALTLDERDHLVDLVSTVLPSAASLPGGFRFILTARTDPRISDRLRIPSLDLTRDAPPGVDDVLEYARRRLEPLSDPAGWTLATRVADQAGGNFLYARHVVNDLLAHPDRIDDPATFALPADLPDVYRSFLQRELAPDRTDLSWRRDYRPVLGLLAVARGDGLLAHQIARRSWIPGRVEVN